MAVSNVAPPHISRLEELGRAAGDGVGDRQHVEGAHAGGEERLMGVAHGGVGDEQALLRGRPNRRIFPGRVS